MEKRTRYVCADVQAQRAWRALASEDQSSSRPRGSEPTADGGRPQSKIRSELQGSRTKIRSSGPPSAARNGSLGAIFRSKTASIAILRPFATLPRSNSSLLIGPTFGHRMGAIYVLLCFDPALEGPFMSVPSIGPGHGFWSKMSVCASERPPPAGSFMSGARLSAVISSPRAFRGPIPPSV